MDARLACCVGYRCLCVVLVNCVDLMDGFCVPVCGYD